MSDQRESEPSGSRSPTTVYSPEGTVDATLGISFDVHSPMTSPPGYEILGLLGRGGMGIVYRASQLSLQRVVALKTISLGPHTPASAAARFEQEAHSIARLQHPHIVTAYDFGRHEGRLFLAMELVDGQDLESWIAERKMLDEATTWGLIRQAAAGLAHAAHAGIVHRDVKPANMLLVTPPTGFTTLLPGLPMLKLTDFGLAYLAEVRSDSRLTTAGITLGSPHYMAPEQVVGMTIDQRTDIYGLGASAYHMLAGTPPFRGENTMQIIASKVKGETANLKVHAPNVSHGTCQLVERMMHAEMEYRPGDYAELLALIDERIQSLVTVDSRVTTSVIKPKPVNDRHRKSFIMWIAAASLAILLAALLANRQFTRSRSDVDGDSLVPADWAAPLCEGVNLSGWLPKTGQWSLNLDDEGGRVIEGSGLIQRTLPQPDKPRPHRLSLYRLSTLADRRKASAVEMQFGFVATAGGPRLVLRLDEEAFRLGSRNDDDAPFNEISQIPRKPSQHAGEQPTYYELRVERHNKRWVAFADGKPFASSEPLNGSERLDIAIGAEGGLAQFTELQITELMPEKPALRPLAQP